MSAPRRQSCWLALPNCIGPSSGPIGLIRISSKYTLLRVLKAQWWGKCEVTARRRLQGGSRLVDDGSAVMLPSSFFDDLAVNGDVGDIPSDKELALSFWYKRTGRRVFRMAPIHHHFEQLGWSEPTVVIRFWIIAFVLALIRAVLVFVLVLVVVVAVVAVAVPVRAAVRARVAELAAAAMAIYVAIIRAREAARHEAQEEDGGTHGSGSDRLLRQPFCFQTPFALCQIAF